MGLKPVLFTLDMNILPSVQTSIVAYHTEGGCDYKSLSNGDFVSLNKLLYIHVEIN